MTNRIMMSANIADISKRGNLALVVAVTDVPRYDEGERIGEEPVRIKFWLRGDTAQRAIEQYRKGDRIVINAQSTIPRVDQDGTPFLALYGAMIGDPLYKVPVDQMRRAVSARRKAKAQAKVKSAQDQAKKEAAVS